MYTGRFIARLVQNDNLESGNGLFCIQNCAVMNPMIKLWYDLQIFIYCKSRNFCENLIVANSLPCKNKVLANIELQ